MKKTRKFENNKKRIGLRVISLGVVALILAIMVQTNNLEKKSQVQAEKIDELKLELEKEEKRTGDIEELSQHMQTKQFVEEVAKDKLGLVYPGEIIFRSSEE